MNFLIPVCYLRQAFSISAECVCRIGFNENIRAIELYFVISFRYWLSFVVVVVIVVSSIRILCAPIMSHRMACYFLLFLVLSFILRPFSMISMAERKKKLFRTHSNNNLHTLALHVHHSIDTK